jgi:hypothetical protein
MKLDQSIKTNFIASMLAFGGAAFSSLAPAITATEQNIALAFGAITATSAIVGFQIKILREVRSE